MKYEDIKDFNQRCEDHPDHQSGMISYGMIEQRLQEEIDELREYIEQRTWVGLSDEELPPLVGDNGKYMELQQVRRFYKAIEAKLRSKNT